MADSQRPGQSGLIPHLVCDPCSEAIEFYKKAFGAEEMMRLPAPDGKRIMHASLTIDGHLLMLADDFPEYCADQKSSSPRALGGTPVTIHRNVPDCDAAVRRAEQAGARVIMPPADMFWGDRYSVLIDPFGHSWSFSTHLRDMTPEEMAEAMRKEFAAHPAP